jgi:hypothetical protein
VRSGELLGHLYKADNTLKAVTDMTPRELRRFEAKASHLATLINKLDPRASPDTTIRPPSLNPEAKESEPADTEYLGWGPKTSDPGPDKIYPSDQLRDVIDVDPKLNPKQ